VLARVGAHHGKKGVKIDPFLTMIMKRVASVRRRGDAWDLSGQRDGLGPKLTWLLMEAGPSPGRKPLQRAAF
jgi:hypothetical protein